MFICHFLVPIRHLLQAFLAVVFWPMTNDKWGMGNGEW
jgi:hypothetical protein